MGAAYPYNDSWICGAGVFKWVDRYAHVQTDSTTTPITTLHPKICPTYRPPRDEPAVVVQDGLVQLGLHEVLRQVPQVALHELPVPGGGEARLGVQLRLLPVHSFTHVFGLY